MNAAQTDIMDQHRSEITKVLSTYSDAAMMWLRNEGYLTRRAEDLVLSEKTNLAKATRILDLLAVADRGWLGLMEYLQQHSNGDLARTLHSELINKLSGAADHADKNETFVNEAVTQAKSSPCASPEISCGTPSWLASLQDKLKSFYKNDFSHVELFFNNKKSVVPLKKLWIDLEVAADRANETHDDYLQILNMAFQSNLPIIVKGEPGIGKSTLVQKICLDWTIGRLPQFDLVICGKMRHVSQAATLLDIALSWTASRCRGINFDILKAHIKNSKLNLLIILDGYDESVCQCDEVERLKSTEPFCLPFTLAITTRPYKLYEIACKHQLLTICGFNQYQQLQFVKNFSKLQSRAPISFSKINDTAGLSALCRIPLFISIICSLNDVENLDGSVTKLLFLLCESLISTYKMSANTSADLTNWRESEWIANVGALALYGLQNFDHVKLCFDDADLKRFSIDSNHVAYSIGFLNSEVIVADTGSTLKVSVSFPHKVVQEFFAALALSSTAGEEFSEMLVGDTQKRLEMQQVLIFLVGMGKGLTNLGAFFHSFASHVQLSLLHPKAIVENELTTLNLVKRECSDQQMADDFLRTTLEKYDIDYILGSLGLQLIVNLYNMYMRLSTSPAIPCKKEDTSQLLFWNSDYTKCVPHFVNSVDKNTEVDYLRDHRDELECAWFAGTAHHLPPFAEILQMSQVSLHSLRVVLERGGEETIVTWPAMNTLKSIMIESTDSERTGLVPKAVQSLLDAQPAIEKLTFLGAENQRVTSLDIHCWSNVKVLMFSQVNFDAVLASQLCKAIDKMQISNLIIAKASIQLEAFGCLCRTLSKQRHLAEFILVSIRMDGLQSPEGCHTFSECCPRLKFLQKFVIMNCGITDAVAECLLVCFQVMKSLKEVNLGWNPFSQAMKSKLRQCLGRQNVELRL